jgi:hypothetical protein
MDVTLLDRDRIAISIQHGGAARAPARGVRPVVERVAQHVAELANAVADRLDVHVEAIGGRARLALGVEPGGEGVEQAAALVCR